MGETMNIYAKDGDKVVFAYPENGYEYESEHAQKYLKVDGEYTIDFTVVYSSSTDVYLKEFPEIPFNLVHFKNKLN